MSDITERLLKWKDQRGYPTAGEMLDEALAEIERLTAEVERHRMTQGEREAADAASLRVLKACADEVWQPLLRYLDRTAPREEGDG